LSAGDDGGLLTGSAKIIESSGRPKSHPWLSVASAPELLS